MSKGILEFDLEEPFSKNSFRRACKATEAYLVLSQFLDSIRTELKYTEDKAEPSRHAVLEELRGELFNRMENLGVDLNDLD